MVVKPRTILFTLVVVLLAATCVRLGLWQVERWHEKQRLNAGLRSALAAPPVEIGASAPPPALVRDRRVRLSGRYDESRQILLVGRAHEGAPGVEVVTPLRLEGGGAVLVERGWLAAADGATARPQDHPEPGVCAVTGLARTLPARGTGRPPARLAGGSDTLWAVRDLDRSLDALFPYALAPFVVRALPDAGAPAQPLRVPPEPYDESMHVSYAIQWFMFAVILVGGSLALAWSRRPGGPLPGAGRGRPAES